MRKLSKTQEKVLRQVAAGQVKLVLVADDKHSIRRWDAVGKDGKKCNPTYDALRKMDLVCCPYIVRQEDYSRKVFLTVAGEDAFKALAPAGVLVYQDFEIGTGTGTGTSWMIRKEQDADEPFVLYRNGEVMARYRQAGDVYEAFRSRCPRRPDREAELSR